MVDVGLFVFWMRGMKDESLFVLGNEK